MPVRRGEIAREIRIAVRKDLQVARGSKAFAEEVRDHVKMVWREAGPHPYETGEFEESIYADKRPNVQGLPHWVVGSDDDKANMIEDGTGPDKPGSNSPFGPNTPTPEFAPFAKTAHYYRGTQP